MEAERRKREKTEGAGTKEAVGWRTRGEEDGQDRDVYCLLRYRHWTRKNLVGVRSEYKRLLLSLVTGRAWINNIGAFLLFNIFIFAVMPVRGPSQATLPLCGGCITARWRWVLIRSRKQYRGMNLEEDVIFQLARDWEKRLQASTALEYKW